MVAEGPVMHHSSAEGNKFESLGDKFESRGKDLESQGKNQT